MRGFCGEGGCKSPQYVSPGQTIASARGRRGRNAYSPVYNQAAGRVSKTELVVDFHPKYSIILVFTGGDSIANRGEGLPMRITCHCSSCGGSYQVDGQYAGRKIKCPKCAAAIVVTAVAEVGASATPPSRAPAATNPLRLAEKIGAEAPAAVQAEPEEAPEEAGSDAVAIPGLEGIAPKHTAVGTAERKHHGKKSSNSGIWLALGGLGVCALVIAAVRRGRDDDELDEDGRDGRQRQQRRDPAP